MWLSGGGRRGGSGRGKEGVPQSPGLAVQSVRAYQFVVTEFFLLLVAVVRTRIRVLELHLLLSSTQCLPAKVVTAIYVRIRL